MKRIVIAAALLAGANVALASEVQEPPVAVEVRGMAPYLAERVQKEAAKGTTALRRYLQMSYSVHQLRVDTVLRDDTKAQLASREAPQQVAIAIAESEQAAK